MLEVYRAAGPIPSTSSQSQSGDEIEDGLPVVCACHLDQVVVIRSGHGDELLRRIQLLVQLTSEREGNNRILLAVEYQNGTAKTAQHRQRVEPVGSEHVHDSKHRIRPDDGRLVWKTAFENQAVRFNRLGRGRRDGAAERATPEEQRARACVGTTAA